VKKIFKKERKKRKRLPTIEYEIEDNLSSSSESSEEKKNFSP
jgi:hypothetical protein